MPFLSLLLNPRVLGALAGIALLIGAVAGIHHKGVMSERAKWEALQANAQAQAIEQVRQVESAKANEIASIDEGYAAKIKVLDSYYQSVLADMRVRKPISGSNRVPATTASPGRTNAADTSGRDGAGNFDPAGNGQRILELGRDLDACADKVTALQAVAISDRAKQQGRK